MKLLEINRSIPGIICIVIGIFSICCGNLSAGPTTAQEAEDIVTGWLKADPKPLGTSLGNRVKRVETFRNENEEPICYIVYLQPSGYVIVSADDLIEPIIGFVAGNSFDPSPENPLGSLVINDLTNRIASVRSTLKLRTVRDHQKISENQQKWRHYIDMTKTSKNKNAISLMSEVFDSISEIRVPPLVKSKWGQHTISYAGDGMTVGEDCPLPCYNYYTPNNYPCGCPATALAQLLRWHEYPTTGIGVHEFTIRIGGWFDNVPQQTFTRGGDGLGGPYNWDLMPYEPNCNSTEAQRQAIGALCYDAGVSINQIYGQDGSGYIGCSSFREVNALKTTFMYANAINGYSGGSSPIGEGLIGMINPNLDAKKPVILGTSKHAFICDGYGYNDSTLYHHLNVGWLGLDDLWYDLRTEIVSPTDGFVYGTFCNCVYNIQTLPAGDGEIVSGRVLDLNAGPIANVILYATMGSEIVASAETDDKGIYAFDCLESNTTYTINAMQNGYVFSSQEITTGISLDDSIISGNLWGIDLVGLSCDFNSDHRVDIDDLVILIEHWGTDDPLCDIYPMPWGDGIVDKGDLQVFMSYWGEDYAFKAHWKLDEISGDMAVDSVGDNDGILYGGPLWQPEGGMVDGALELDGVDDYVSTPFVLNPADGPFSVFAWIKGGFPGQTIISQVDGENWLSADISDGILMTELKGGGRSRSLLISQTLITDDSWHWVGFTWDGVNRILYVDDFIAGIDTQSNLQSSEGGLYIGTGKGLEPGTFWTGLIDDVRIYDRVITP